MISIRNFRLGSSFVINPFSARTRWTRFRRLDVLVALSTTCLSACSAHRPPVVEDKVGGFFGINEERGRLAVAPDYSVAFVQLSNSEHRASDDRGNKFCAQGPADAGSDLSSALSGAVKAASGQGQTLDRSGAARFASRIRQLFVRSQGVQFFRDGSFALCGACLNGAINRSHHQERLAALRETAAALIENQISYMDRITPDSRKAWMASDGDRDARSAPGAASQMPQ